MKNFFFDRVMKIIHTFHVPFRCDKKSLILLAFQFTADCTLVYFLALLHSFSRRVFNLKILKMHLKRKNPLSNFDSYIFGGVNIFNAKQTLHANFKNSNKTTIFSQAGGRSGIPVPCITFFSKQRWPSCPTKSATRRTSTSSMYR